MKCFLPLFFVGIGAASYASVFYDNGGPNLRDGHEMSEYSQSEDIPYTSQVEEFNTLRFWTLQATNNLQTVSVIFSYDNGAGNPGTIAVSLPNLAVSQTVTGRSLYGFIEYENVVALGPLYESGVGIFHIELLANQASNPNLVKQGIYWETAEFNGTNSGRQSFHGLRQSWESTLREHAFRLENVPEPTTIAVAGLAAVAALRRRIRK